MATSLLAEILSEEELNQLVVSSRQKLEGFASSKKSATEGLQGEIEKIKADYEQKCYELDKKLIENASRLDTESLLHGKVSEKCTELENELKESKLKISTLETSFHELQQENIGLRRIKETWSGEKLNFQHIIEKRDLEISQLNDEWKTVSDRLSEALTGKNELQLKLDEISSSEVTTHYQTKRLEHEKDMLTQQNASLTEELNQKNNQLLLYRKEKENEIISLRSQLGLSCNEVKTLKNTTDDLKKDQLDLQEKLKDLHEKNTKTTEDFHSMEEMHRNELQSQVRLAQLYKASSEDADKKASELISAVEELQTLVKSSANKTEELQAQLHESQNKLMEKTVETERLKKELENANDLIAVHRKRELSDEELSELCPTAAMTSRFIKSGMTLTQIYSKYVEQSDELIVAKEENKRLNEAMDSILEELNAKAPILKRQREDYERALVTINQLTSQTDEAALNFQQLRQEADDASRHSAHLERENARCRKEANDLSKQIRFLLKEVEELRGRQVQMSSPGQRSRADRSLLVVNDDGSCNDVSSSSELITRTLVTFKDIGELQEQNQKLLAVIRKLSDEQEAAESSDADRKTSELRRDLEEANAQLEQLREDRSRQGTMVEAIVRQRDMYRVLLAANPQAAIPPSVLANPSSLDASLFDTSGVSALAGPASATPQKSGALERSTSKSPMTSSTLFSGEQTKKALVQLQEEFEEYKSDVKENNRVFEDKIDKLQSELSGQRSNCAKLSAQLEFSKERCDMLKQGEQSAKKESDALRARNTQLYSIAQRHEHDVSNLNAELSAAQESNAKLQGRLEALRSELALSKRAEDRLTTENASLQREQRNQGMLLGNLQKVQQSMERQAFEVRSQLHGRVEAQDKEIASLRQNSHDIAQGKQDAVQAVEKQLYAVQQMHEAEKARSEKLTVDLLEAKSQCNMLQAELKKTEAKLASVEDRFGRLGGDASEVSASSEDSSSSVQMRQELREKTEEIKSLEARLDRARNHVDHYKEVSSAAEETLKQSNQANKELMESLQSRLDASSKEQTLLEQRIVAIEEENKSLKNEKYKVTGEVERQTMDLRKQLTAVQSELEGALRRAQEAVKNEQVARDDLSRQFARAEESNDNYQREMILHASAVSQLMELKEHAKGHGDELEKLKSANRSLEESLGDKTTSWIELEEKMKAENELHKQRIKDIESQNELLHSQVEKLSSQLVELKSKESSSSGGDISSSLSPLKLFRSRDPVAVATGASGGEQSSEQLIDVIKFLRREKEISDTKCELVQAESARVNHKLQQLTKQATDTQELLTKEQAKTQEQVEKLSKMAGLERELHSLRSVKKEVQAIREERDRISAEAKATVARLTKLQEDVAPMQAKHREMSAQCVGLQAEKRSLSEEVDRWKDRVQQMTKSPRRQDPEEYRRLMQEKAALAKQMDSANRENAELKSEASTLKGQVRALESRVQSLTNNVASLEQSASIKNDETTKLNAEIEKHKQTDIKLRRVGRRYKALYEELVAKQQKEKETQEKNAGDAAAAAAKSSDQTGAEKKTEDQGSSDALKEAQENCSKAMEEKARIQAELSQANEANKSLKEEKQALEKKLLDTESSSSEVMGECIALRTQVEEQVKTSEDAKKRLEEMTTKENRFTNLLNLAKSQIEKLRRDCQDSHRDRDRLQEELKTETEGRAELQTKVEDLQRQVLEGRAAATPAPEPRRTANVRPTSSTRVNQVTPMRVTRTARVIPEPQQDAPDTERPGPSSVAQVGSSSTPIAVTPAVAASISSVSSLSSPTAFVHPISPARPQQQVVSSGTQPTQAPSAPAPSQTPETGARGTSSPPSADGTENDQAIVSSSDDQTVQEELSAARGHPSSSATSVSSASTEQVEASSSSAVRYSSSTSAGASSSTGGISSGASSSSGAGASASVAPRIFLGAQKRAHEQTEENSFRSVAVAASTSRETQQATVAPQPKRQRKSPDQSSESIAASASVPPSDADTMSIVSESPEWTRVQSSCRQVKFHPFVRVARLRYAASFSCADRRTDRVGAGYRRKKARSKNDHLQSVSSGARQPDQSQQADTDDLSRVSSQPETTQPAQASQVADQEAARPDSGFNSAEGLSFVPAESSSSCRSEEKMPTSSSSIMMEEQNDVIVLSSDDDDVDFPDQEDVEVDEEDEDEVEDDGEEEVEGEEEEEEEMEEENEESEVDSSAPSSSAPRGMAMMQSRTPAPQLPFLSLTPSDPGLRSRAPSRPAPGPPLTPGLLVPSSTDGDSIVPCTPTLPPNRPDETYQIVSSPRVPPGNHFRFELPPGQNLAAVPGGLMDAVDNTFVDLAGAGDDNSRSVPVTPTPSSSTVFSTTSTLAQIDTSELHTASGNAAVSSSNVQGDDPDEDPDDAEAESHVSSVEVLQRTNIPTARRRGRGRGRLRIRGLGTARQRGKGANSPSTSNQP